MVSHTRLGPAALRAGGLLKELLQVGAQEVLQRFKLGVRDWKLQGDILHDKRRRTMRPLLRFAFIEVHMVCHAALLDSGGAD